MEKQDLRLVTVLATWFGIHAAWVNADRLPTLATTQSSARVRAFWSALARWQRKDFRFVRLSASYKGPRQDVLEVGTEFRLERHGEDPRFAGSAIRLAANVLRDRPADVLSPSLRARRHRVYRFRVMMGPNYRADMWAALESEATLSAAALARETYGSFATVGMFDATTRNFESENSSFRAQEETSRHQLACNSPSVAKVKLGSCRQGQT